jgi:hypothetical protein
MLGHLFRTQEQNTCRKLTVHKPEGTGRVGRPGINWLESDEKDMSTRVLETGDKPHRIRTNGEPS